MKPEMVLDEAGYEEIAVIVTLSQAQIERHARAFASLAQQFRPKLGFEKLILRALSTRRGGPFQPRASIRAAASYSRQAPRSGPRYPVSAFSPQGQRIGEEIGAKADTDL